MRDWSRPAFDEGPDADGRAVAAHADPGPSGLAQWATDARASRKKTRRAGRHRGGGGRAVAAHADPGPSGLAQWATDARASRKETRRAVAHRGGADRLGGQA